MLNAQEAIITASPNISDNMSALPAGIIRHPKPLSNNHYILTSADDIAPATEISWRILQNRIANKDPDKPLVVAAFEEHSIISDILLRVDLLARFALHQKAEPDDKSRRFIYAHEYPYNLLHKYIQLAYKTDLPNKYKYTPNEIDPDNHILMKAIIAKNILVYAPQTNNVLFGTCLQYGIKTYFNDAAKTNNFRYLDSNDPNINLPRKNISGSEKDGISIRNEFMAQRILRVAKEDGVDVIIQGIGSNHGGNKTDKDFPYEESYLEKCRDNGAEVTSIFMSSISDNYTAERIIPKQALKDDPNMIIIDGMPEYRGFLLNPYGEHKNLNLLTCSHSNPHLITPTDPSPTENEVMELVNDVYMFRPML